MTEDDSDGEWLTIMEAARRLGVKPGAIRSRIQRKTIRVRPGKQANDGLVRVWIERSAAPASAATSDATSELIAELRARLADRDRELDRLASEKEQLAQELTAERRHARDLADRLDQVHRDRLTEAARRWREESDLAEKLRQAEAARERAERDLAAVRRRPWWRLRRRG